MKAFNYEQAKAGAPVCTRKCKEARIITFDRDDKRYPIGALVRENDKYEFPRMYSTDGKMYAPGMKGDNPLDLVMRGSSYTGWVNIYTCDASKGAKRSVSHIYASEEQAKAVAIDTAGGKYVTTVEIKWEE